MAETPASPASLPELRKQYEALAEQCSTLARTLPMTERMRAQEGGTIKLSADGQRFRELMQLKALASAEVNAALERQRVIERRKAAEARKVLESVGEIAPSAQQHEAQRSLVEN